MMAGRYRLPWTQEAQGASQVLLSCVTIQVSASLSVEAMRQVGTLGASGVRFAFAAVAFLLVARPRPSGKTRGEWRAIGVFGVAIAAMNVFLYEAISRMPLGSAVSIEFCGPFVVGLASSRRIREALWALAACAGVFLIATPSDASVTGILFAAAASACWAAYLLANRAVGASVRGKDGLALSVTLAAVCTIPVSTSAWSQLTPDTTIRLAISALLGVVIAYSLELSAVKLASARIVSICFGLDPAVAAVAGWLLLHQRLAIAQVCGVALVVIAGVGAVAGRASPKGGS